jgi:UDP-N-acetylmuramate dehydrogenase
MPKIQENIPLSRYTSLHVGGPARYFVGIKNEAEAIEVLTWAQQQKLPVFILGQGSNTLFPDTGWPGVVLHMEDRSLSVAGQTITAGSGVFMRLLTTFALDHGLRGLEELAGIPGTVGGSIRGNAGTWSTEIKDVLDSVDVLMPHGERWVVRTLTPAECQFGYRHSLFKLHPEWVILRGRFTLQPGDVAEGQRLVAEDLKQRHTKQPYDAPSAGSVFKNPDKANHVFSGSLIEKAGLKGARHGGAEISSKHANFIVNRSKATSADIHALIRLAQTKVKETSGIDLEPEIVIVGEL